MHYINPNLPLRGIGLSGTGGYHGKAGFIEFSHFKSILIKSNIFEPFFKYTPYTKLKLRLVKIFYDRNIFH